MPDIESALFLHRPPQKGDQVADQGADRIYFGAEFCPWRFPSVKSILNCYQTCQELQLAFTLVTPILNESFLPDFQKSLKYLSKDLPADVEIVVSDVGALNLCREYFPLATLIVGRVLSGQKRGPRILDLELNDEQGLYFKKGSWYSDQAAKILTDKTVNRIELDNLLQGVAPLTNGLKAALHYPYIMVTSSRNCPFRTAPHEGRCRGGGCGCGEIFSLKNDETAVPLLQGGNTQFIENHQLPEDLTALGIDRIIYHPQLPR